MIIAALYNHSTKKDSSQMARPAERAMELHGPIQGRFGELDKNPPADEMRKLDAELKRLGKPHEFYFYRTQAMLSIEKAGKVPA